MHIYIQHSVIDPNIGVPFAKVQSPRKLIVANQCALPMKRSMHVATILPGYRPPIPGVRHSHSPGFRVRDRVRVSVRVRRTVGMADPGNDGPEPLPVPTKHTLLSIKNDYRRMQSNWNYRHQSPNQTQKLGTMYHSLSVTKPHQLPVQSNWNNQHQCVPVIGSRSRARHTAS